MRNKLGIFVHWGLYSLYGDHEQILARRDLNAEEYEKRMHEFDPTEYDPEEWVLLAKSAGAKYICFTAKHHDGFCMWDTKYSDYTIMNTPYGKDVLKMLSDACRKHDMLLSIYYSNPDWYHAYGYNPASSHQWKAKQTACPDTEKYREYIKNQITELLTNYGDIYTLFWDILPRYEDISINQLARKLQPDILINDRGYSKGDFATPERNVPDGVRFERMTEACESVGEVSWGYRSNEDYHSDRFLMSCIDKVMAMGGSYLLNIGPMQNGKFPQEAIDIINRIGSWYTRLDGCIEGSQPDDFIYEFPENRKMIAVKKNGKTYLNFYEGLLSSAVILFTYPSFPKKVKLMNTGEALPFEMSYLPNFVDSNGCAKGPYLRIHSIPVNDLVHEPIVVEIEY